MSKSNKLLAQFGEQINESLGQRDGGSLGLVDAPSTDRRFEGRRMARDTADIDIGLVVTDTQYRQHFDEAKLRELADSLQSSGQIQPIVVRWDGTRERYVVIAGERRLRAARLAGFKRIRCDVRDETLADEKVAEIQLAENCAREDLNPIERAQAFSDLTQRFGCTARDLAKRVGVNETTVTRHLKLLLLPDDVQVRVASGEVSYRIAREAARAPDDESRRLAVDAAMKDRGGESAAHTSTQASRSRARTGGTDRRVTVRSGTRFRITSPHALSPEELVDDVRSLLQRLEDDGVGQ